jgi:enoyl-CoA hydratase/carnithine racemase
MTVRTAPEPESGPGASSGIRVEIDDRVGLVVIDRPAASNALTAAMRHHFVGALADLEADATVRAIVVASSGEHFSVGMDVKEGGEDAFAGLDAKTATLRRMWDIAPWRSVTPVIGALKGYCVGLGATLPLLFDVRIAADTAKIGFVFTRRGLPPELDASYLLPRIVGLGHASDLLLSGRIVPAAEALHMGLVNRVVPEDEVLDVALGYARDIARSTSPEAVAVAKRMLWQHLGPYDAESAHRRERELGERMLGRDDIRVAVRAFLTRETPQWRSSKHTTLADDLDTSKPAREAARGQEDES